MHESLRTTRTDRLPGAVPLAQDGGMRSVLLLTLLLLAGGLTALQGMITIAALPFALLMLLVMWSLYRVLDMEYALQRRRAQRPRGLQLRRPLHRGWQPRRFRVTVLQFHQPGGRAAVAAGCPPQGLTCPLPPS